MFVSAPIRLFYHSCRIYAAPCLSVMCQHALLGLPNMGCSCCDVFEDPEFPANHKSLGNWKHKTPAELDRDVKWMRARDLLSQNNDGKVGEEPMLFPKSVRPEDIVQGQLGDCWLLTAFSCLAEFGETIRRCFVTKTFNQLGKYELQLYDPSKSEWVTVIIDDRLPTSNNKPIFAAPKGNMLWVLLLEKAFAKLCGSYEALAGSTNNFKDLLMDMMFRGHSAWAFQVMTGDFVRNWRLTESKVCPESWKRWDVMFFPPKDGNVRRIGLKETDETRDNDAMFKMLTKYDKLHCFMAASSNGGDDTKQSRGIVQGHAYSLIRVQRVGDFKMLCLRNPWGETEWTGDWGDNSPLWTAHPKVATALDFKKGNDGIFWMVIIYVITVHITKTLHVTTLNTFLQICTCGA
jgi:hypothetical protein